MMLYFQRILQEFDKQNAKEQLIVNENELKMLLKNLNFKEKTLICNIFKTVSWNIGSLNVLKILQDSEVLSASEYLLLQGNSEDDFEHVQAVISDMLESNGELLANIINNCTYNSSNTKLIFYLEEAIQRLLKDFQEDENIIAINLFTKVTPFLEEEAIQYLTNLHINFLLELNTSNLRQALGQVDNWKLSISKDSKFYDLLKEIVKSNISSTANKILQTSLYPNFNHWKYLVIILDVIAKNSNQILAASIKKHLRETFKTAVTKGSFNLMLSLLIVARTVCSETEVSFFDTYSQFYKNTIGDLKYVATNKTEFENILDILYTIIEIEIKPKYLEVHARISINSLPHCNEMILKYKQKCRRKIDVLSTPQSPKRCKANFEETSDLDDADTDLFIHSQDLIVLEDD